MPAATRTTSSPIFSVNELVVCVERNCPYAAKITAIKEHQKVVKYFIHYMGWNKSTDIKVPVGNEEGRLFKGSVAEYVEAHRDTIESLFLAAYDEKTGKEAPAKNTPAKETPAAKKKKSEVAAIKTPKTPQTSEAAPKKKKVETPAADTSKTPKNAEAVSAKKPKKVETPAADAPASPQDSDDADEVKVDFDWRFDFPTNLMELCIEDRARIHHGQLTRLPASVTIDAIVDMYEESLGMDSDAAGTSSEADKKDFLLVSVDGIREYFNKVLHAHFLYAAERQQYNDAKQDDPDFSPSANYGVVHLLRAFTTLAKSIKEAKMQSRFAEELVSNSKVFIEYLSKNLETLGVEYYEPAGEEDEEA